MKQTARIGRFLVPQTPVTDRGLRKLDGLSAVDAVVTAWADPGLHWRWHHMTRRVVRASMPLVARALDRMAEEAYMKRRGVQINGR